MIGHQFKKYQQNEQSPLLLSHWIHGGNTGPGLGQTHKYGGLNRLMGSQPSSLDKDVPT